MTTKPMRTNQARTTTNRRRKPVVSKRIGLFGSDQLEAGLRSGNSRRVTVVRSSTGRRRSTDIGAGTVDVPTVLTLRRGHDVAFTHEPGGDAVLIPAIE